MGLRRYKASENEANYTVIFKARSHKLWRMKALQYSYENTPLTHLYVDDSRLEGG
jgi:hypothetical protein